MKINLSKEKIFFFFFPFILGVYGDVHRVKILFNKKDSALIQFATPQQAAVGKKSLIKSSYIFILFLKLIKILII
jgi:hypothetical protein